MEEILALALQQVVAAVRVFNSLKFTVVGGGNKSGGDPGYVPSFLSSSKGKHLYGLSYMQSFSLIHSFSSLLQPPTLMIFLPQLSFC